MKPKKEKKIKIDALDDNKPEESAAVEPPVNPYYATVSYRYKLAKYLVIFILVIYVLFSITLHRESITYSNFVFLLKDMNTVFESDGMLSVQKTINYNTDRNQIYALYRNGLAVAGSSNIYLFNSAGKQTLNEQVHYSQPYFSVSEKYILLYDLGGKGYSLYNSFAKIHSGELDYPISGAKISDAGVYAIISKDKEYTSSVFIYNKNFELIEKNRKDKYITDISLDKNGKELLIVSCESENGEYYTEISASMIGSGQEHIKLKKTGLFPIKVEHTDSGGFFVLCDKALLVFDENYKEINRIDFGVSTISRADFYGNRAAMVLSENTAEKDNRLLFVDEFGDIIYSGSVSGKINSVFCSEKQVYLLFDSEIKRFVPENGEITVTSINAGVKDMMILNESTALLCYSSYTRYVDLK